MKSKLVLQYSRLFTFNTFKPKSVIKQIWIAKNFAESNGGGPSLDILQQRDARNQMGKSYTSAVFQNRWVKGYEEFR